MSAQEHLKVLLQRWMTIVVVVLIAAGLGVAYLVLRPAAYTASLQMYVSSPAAGTTEAVSLSGAQLAQDRVKSYQELVGSARVLSAAIAAVDSPLTVPELRDKVGATTTDESVVMVINVDDDSATRAATLADAVGQALTATVDNLERPAGPGAAAVLPVMTIRAVEPAPVPDQQSSASPKRVLGIAILLGLAVGVSLALARNSADSSIKTPEQLAEVVDAPNLGNITIDSAVNRRGLLVLDHPTSPATEDFRRLRTNLQFIEADKEHKVLMVCSALASEGKTTTAVNVALALTAAGHRVLLVDADLRRPAIAERLGLSNDAGLTNVLAGSIGLFQAVSAVPSAKLDVLVSGTLPPNPSELLASAQCARAIEQARTRYDVVLIDTPPLLPVSDAAALAPFADAALLVCRGNRTSTVDVRRASQALRAVKTKVGGTVLIGGNKSGRLGSYTYATPHSAVAAVGVAAVGPPKDSAAGARTTHASEPLPISDTGGTRRRPRPHPPQSRAAAPDNSPVEAGTEQMARWNGHG